MSRFSTHLAALQWFYKQHCVDNVASIFVNASREDTGTDEEIHGTWGSRRTSSPPGDTVFFRRPLMSQTRTVWSRLALTTCVVALRCVHTRRPQVHFIEKKGC